VIKQLDKRENVERIMRVQDYEKEKLLDKIGEKMTRAETIKAEREQLLSQRAQMKKEIEQQKREMYEKIDKVKQGKMNPNEILMSLSIQKEKESINNISRSPPKPAKSAQPQKPQ
jgi:hypothetical protein